MNFSEIPLPFDKANFRSEDKSEWGEGPWQEEPDWAVWSYIRGRFAMAMCRNRFGALCGYVGLPKQSQLWGITYDSQVKVKPELFHTTIDVNKDIGVMNLFLSALKGQGPGNPEGASAGLLLHCHGGVNFGKEGTHGFWFIGFDCSHAGDATPAAAARDRKLGLPPFGFQGNDVYRRWDYVKANVEKLARSVHTLEENLLEEFDRNR